MKRIICLILACFMLTVQAFADESVNAKKDFGTYISSITFDDMSYLPVDHWSDTAVFTISALDIMKGDGYNFMPDKTVTADEAFAVIFRCAGLEEQAWKIGSKVAELKQKNPDQYNYIDEWADGYLRLAVDKKLITVDEYMSCNMPDYPNETTTFFKDREITRADFVRWIITALNIPLAEKESEVCDFFDYSSINEEDRLYIETALRNGIISGNGYDIMPYVSITREQLAQIFLNTMDLWIEKTGIIKYDGQIDSVQRETKNETDKLINTASITFGDNTVTTIREYRLNGEAVDYNFDSSLIYEDFPVISKNSLPTDSTALNNSDTVSVFIRDNTVLCVLKNYTQQINSEVIDDTYYDGDYYSGTLYLYDDIENMVLLKYDEKIIEIPCHSEIKFYNKVTELDKNTINDKWVDKRAVVFTVERGTSGIDRAYRVQLMD